jgi:hypothetical protein
MKLPSLWSSSQNLMSDPYRSIRREMEDMFRTFDRHLPSLRVDRNWRLAPVRCEAAVRPKAGPSRSVCRTLELTTADIQRSLSSVGLTRRRTERCLRMRAPALWCYLRATSC